MNGNGAGRPSTDWRHMTLEQLKDKAAVDKTETTKYRPKQWLRTIANLYDEGDKDKLYNNDKIAYYHYLKGCNVMVEILNYHPNLSEVQELPAYKELLARTRDEIIDTLYDLKWKIESQQRQQQQLLSPPDGDVDIEQSLKKFPEISDLEADLSGSSKLEISSLDELLPSAPTHTPQLGRQPPKPQPRPVVSRKPVPSPVPQVQYKMNMPTPQPTSDLHIHMPISQPNTRHGTGGPGGSSNNPEYALQLPGRTSFNFPQIMVVEPKELASWIAIKPNQPSVLLLDVRPRAMYEDASIRHTWVCQIEPLVLRPGVTSDKIQTTLVLTNDVHQELFRRRNEFDLIVFYDQESKRLEDAYDPLRNLRSAIYENEFHKPLARIPMMLAGGFSAWCKAIGDRGIVGLNSPKSGSKAADPTGPTDMNGAAANASTSAAPQKENINRHWLRNVVGKGPSARREHVHSSTFDYFIHKHRPNDIPATEHAPSQRPPLQGIFANSIEPRLHINDTLPITMPIVQPDIPPSSENAKTSTTETISANYPEIRPNRSGAIGLQRRNTYIDNPFNGFTQTKNDLYEGPPIPPKPKLPGHPPLPPPHAYRASPPAPSPSAPPPTTGTVPPAVPAKPTALTTSHHIAADTRQAPVSDSSLSQLGSVVIGTTGLKNLGNTCFMNSIVQCLSGTIPLARYLISGTYKRDVNKTNPLGTGGVLVQSFADLLRVMWSGSYSFISPVSFREALGRFAPQFAGTDQQDSQEFLLFLLDGLHEDVNLITQRPSPQPEDPAEEARFERLPDWEASAISWAKYLERNRSIIVDLFQGQYRSRLTCLTCKHTSTTYNTFMSLSLPIPKGKSTVTLYQCLDAFVKEEILEKDDAWHCPRCKTLRRSSKRLTLSRLPVVLLIHLKRFSFDGPFHNKLETLVDYPVRDLDLSRYIPDTMCPPDMRERTVHRYDLYGVSNHYGSLTAGHYTSCVRNGYRQEWHYFDDTRFSVCDEDKAVSRAAYNLFYVRSTVK